MSDGQIIIEVELEDNNINKEINTIERKVSKSGKNMEGAFGKVGGSVKALTKGLAIGATAIAGVGAAAVGVGMKLAEAAGAAQAMNAQFSQVFGDLEKDATKSLNAIAEETNMLPERLKGSFTQMAAFAKTTGMDTKDAMNLTNRATRAAADSAAFYDKSIEEVTESLQSFLKGNYENDAALGISATETTRNAKANELYGQSFKDLSEAQKQLTLLAMVEDGNKLSGALGQAAREGDGFENTMGNMKQAWENLKVALGTPILPVVIKGMNLLTSAMEKVGDLDFGNIKNLSGDLGIIGDVIDHVENRFKLFYEVGRDLARGIDLKPFVETFKTVQKMVIPILEEIVDYMDDVVNDIRSFWEKEGTNIISAMNKVFSFISKVAKVTMPAIGFLIGTVWNSIKDVIGGALKVITSSIKMFTSIINGDWKGLWEGIKGYFVGMVKFLIGFLSLTFLGGIRNIFVNLGKTVLNSTKGLVTGVINFFKNLLTNAVKIFNQTRTLGGSIFNAMKNFIINIVVGLKNGVISWITNMKNGFINVVNNLRSGVSTAFNKVKETILNVFKSFSLVSIGTQLVEQIIKGILDKVPGLESTLRGIANKLPDWAKELLGIKGGSQPIANLKTQNIVTQKLTTNSKTLSTPKNSTSNSGFGVPKNSGTTINNNVSVTTKNDKTVANTVGRELKKMQMGYK